MSFHLHPDRDALFLDIDGTLLDIAPDPDAVTVPDGLKTHLAHLHGKLGGALALVSGRSIDNIDALFAPLRLPASGIHGAQWRIVGKREECPPLPQAVRDAVRQEAARFAGLYVEDKRYAIAVHYRHAPQHGPDVERFLQNIASRSDGLGVMHGKMVCEILHPDRHKGTAVEHFIRHAPFAGRRPVYIGDDVTDLFAMRACENMGGMTAHVGQSGGFFSSPVEVRQWLKSQAA